MKYIPNAQLLEKHFETYLKQSDRYLLFLQFLTVLLLTSLVFSYNVINLPVLSMVFLYVFGKNFYELYPILFAPRKPLSKVTRNLGPYSPPEVRGMLQRVLDHFPEKDRPEIYVQPYRTMEASSISVWFPLTLRPLKALYLSMGLFHVLEKEEIQSIIAHELAHYYRYTSRASRYVLFLSFFGALFTIVLISAVLSLFDAGFLHVLGFIPVLILVYEFVFSLLRDILESEERSQEYLSDLFAARFNGKLNAINGLLGQKENWRFQNWRLFDYDERDHRVNNREYPHLLKALTGKPAFHLFRLLNENQLFNIGNPHPTIRERVLFIEKNL